MQIKERRPRAPIAEEDSFSEGVDSIINLVQHFEELQCAQEQPVAEEPPKFRNEYVLSEAEMAVRTCRQKRVHRRFWNVSSLFEWVSITPEQIKAVRQHQAWIRSGRRSRRNNEHVFPGYGDENMLRSLYNDSLMDLDMEKPSSDDLPNLTPSEEIVNISVASHPFELSQTLLNGLHRRKPDTILGLCLRLTQARGGK